MGAEQIGAVWAKTKTLSPELISPTPPYPQSGCPEPAETASPDLVLGMFDI